MSNEETERTSLTNRLPDIAEIARREVATLAEGQTATDYAVTLLRKWLSEIPPEQQFEKFVKEDLAAAALRVHRQLADATVYDTYYGEPVDDSAWQVRVAAIFQQQMKTAGPTPRAFGAIASVDENHLFETKTDVQRWHEFMRFLLAAALIEHGEPLPAAVRAAVLRLLWKAPFPRRLGAGKRGPKKKELRDRRIRLAVERVVHGYNLHPTRNRETKEAQSACSVVAEALGLLGMARSEAVVEKIYQPKKRRPKGERPKS